jgi:hypothetical protein
VNQEAKVMKLFRKLARLLKRIKQDCTDFWCIEEDGLDRQEDINGEIDSLGLINRESE